MEVKNKKGVYFDEYVDINGIKQYLLHSGKNKNNQVMLFLHGGPGSVESLFAHATQEKWEEIYTVVHWDQRGSGKTLSKNSSKKDYPNIEILIDDLFKIVNYLREKYNQDKIVILGYSWGSVLGTDFIKKYPELVSYYIGVGQVVDMYENEKLAYQKVLEEIKRKDNKRDLKKLLAFEVYPEKTYTKSMKRKVIKLNMMQQKYKITNTNSLITVKNFLKSPIFKFSDIISFIKGLNSNKKLMEYLITYNLKNLSLEYKLPIYYILGRDDWEVPSSIGENYFDKIIAPSKKIYIINDCRHKPMLEQKEKFENILFEIEKLNRIIT